MPTVHELIAARLSATGMDSKVALRLTGLIVEDLRRSGFGIVKTEQLDFLVTELVALQSNLKVLADAWLRLERKG